MTPLHVVVLAAGQGTRMRSRLPKVLQPLGDRPLLTHVVETAAELEPSRIHVVYGHGAELVQQRVGYLAVNWVHQADRKGTGHAVQQAMPHIPDQALVLVLYGDVPLTRADTLKQLVEAAREAVALLTIELRDPTGYGRILRDANRRVTGIVEHKDASESQRALRECNTGLLCASARSLRGWLAQLKNNNVQGEYYLTDIVGKAVGEGVAVNAIPCMDEHEVAGVNDRAQLAELERVYQMRKAQDLMRRGLYLKDPARFDLRGSLEFGRDVTIDVDVVIEGDVKLGDDVTIGPFCWLKNCEIASGTHVLPHTVIDRARIGERCHVGPFARLRPDSVLGDHARVGNFVEMKKSTLGAGSKVNHLAYVGDTEVGMEVNIGAGVITCNYDGAKKHKTIIGDGAFIGSDVQLVAPVTIGAGATIGAGSTITKDAPDHKLTLSRAKQMTLESWQRPTKKQK